MKTKQNNADLPYIALLILSLSGCAPIVVQPDNIADIKIGVVNDSAHPFRVNGVWFDDTYDTAWTTTRPDSIMLDLWCENCHLELNIDGQPSIYGGWLKGQYPYTTIYLPRK